MAGTFCSKIRRGIRFFRFQRSGKEWEADFWAACAFVYLARHLGFCDELKAFRNRHPEKAKSFF